MRRSLSSGIIGGSLGIHRTGHNLGMPRILLGPENAIPRSKSVHRPRVPRINIHLRRDASISQVRTVNLHSSLPQKNL